MASLGAKVLQVRSVEVAMVHKVKLYVRSSFDDPADPKLGTLICDEEDIVEQQIVTGIAFSRDEAQITLRDVADKPGVAAAIFGPLADANINVDMIIQVVSEDSTTTDITFTVSGADFERAKEIIEARRDLIGFARLNGTQDVVKISAIGVGMRSHSGVAARAFKALSRQGHQHPRDHDVRDQVLDADRRGLHRARGAHAAFALRARREGVNFPHSAVGGRFGRRSGGRQPHSRRKEAMRRLYRDRDGRVGERAAREKDPCRTRPVRDHHPTTSASVQLRDIRKVLPLRVLSEDDWRHLDRQGLRDRPAGGPARQCPAPRRPAVALRREGPERPLDLARAAAARAQDEGTQQHRDARDLQSSISLGQPDGAAHLRRVRRHLGPGGPLGDHRQGQSQSAEAGQGEPARVHPLGRRHVAVSASDRGAGLCSA